MRYRPDEKSGRELSALGFGCMRLPREAAAEKLVLRALELGVNYFDTAYAYPGNEELLGRIMARNGIREQMLIATKLPHNRVRSLQDATRFLETSLRHLQTDHVEYYLVHNMVSLREWERLEELGLGEWLQERKRAGQIGSVGFSSHGSHEEFMKLLDAYPWDMCQIQYNYANEHYQAGRAGLEAAAERRIPVVIMEPLLGGRLAQGLPKKAAAVLAAVDAQASPASWAFKWLWDQPGVTCVLSGMNELSQLEDNAAVAETSGVGFVTPVERAALEAARDVLTESFRVPCTGCNYCMPCPKGINIPAAFTTYNNSYLLGWKTGVFGHVTSIGAQTSAPHLLANCANCGKCAQACPQHIDIPARLRDVRKRIEPAPVRVGVKVVSKLTHPNS